MARPDFARSSSRPSPGRAGIFPIRSGRSDWSRVRAQRFGEEGGGARQKKKRWLATALQRRGWSVEFKEYDGTIVTLCQK